MEFRMSDWLSQVSGSLLNQVSGLLVAMVLAILGLFSGKLVETIKFALNRADLRSKYYEQIAVDISHLVFITSQIIRVYDSAWIGDDGKRALAEEYDGTMNKVFRMEYVYLFWVKRYWGRSKYQLFIKMMDALRILHEAFIRKNEYEASEHETCDPEAASIAEAIKSAFDSFQRAAREMLL
jgi:hypothetical protein